jgi:hypothetical protein
MYMSSAGVDDSIILAKIDASGHVFDLSTREIVTLWEAGVSPDVIEYMIATGGEAGGSGDRPYDDVEYEDDYDDDDIVVVGHSARRVHLYFGFGYYDSWYYPYWWWHRPYNYGYYSYGYGYGHYWPYYYHCSPYAYYNPYDCWSYRNGRHVAAGHGIRHAWRRSGNRGDSDYGDSGYRLKPRYSKTGGKRGDYLARDGRYVFPKDGKGREYTGRGYRKPLAYGGRPGAGYGDPSSRSKYGRSGYTKTRSGKVTRSRTTKDGRQLSRRYKGSQSQDGTPKRVTKSRSGKSSSSNRSQVKSSRSRSSGSRSSGSRSSVKGGRSSGSSGSSRSSSGSSRGSSSGSSRGGRRK